MRAIRRFLAFIASRLFFVTLIVSLAILSFYTAMNVANIWILTDEGLEARARAVIQGTDMASLTNYFTEEFILQDPVLMVGTGASSPYRDYSVRGITHKTTMHTIWAWPWDNTATAEVTESIPSIDGTILAAQREAALAAGGEERLKPPAWETNRYRVTLARTGGRWKISALQRMEIRN